MDSNAEQSHTERDHETGRVIWCDGSCLSFDYFRDDSPERESTGRLGEAAANARYYYRLADMFRSVGFRDRNREPGPSLPVLHGIQDFEVDTTGEDNSWNGTRSFGEVEGEPLAERRILHEGWNNNPNWPAEPARETYGYTEDSGDDRRWCNGLRDSDSLLFSLESDEGGSECLQASDLTEHDVGSVSAFDIPHWMAK